MSSRLQSDALTVKLTTCRGHKSARTAAQICETSRDRSLALNPGVHSRCDIEAITTHSTDG